MFFETLPFVMTIDISPWIDVLARLFLSMSLVLAVIRMIIGPHPIDRVIALDLIAGIVMALGIYHAIQEDQAFYLNVSLAIAVISFLGTIAFARYIERRALNLTIPDPVDAKSLR